MRVDDLPVYVTSWLSIINIHRPEGRPLGSHVLGDRYPETEDCGAEKNGGVSLPFVCLNFSQRLFNYYLHFEIVK